MSGANPTRLGQSQIRLSAFRPESSIIECSSSAHQRTSSTGFRYFRDTIQVDAVCDLACCECLLCMLEYTFAVNCYLHAVSHMSYMTVAMAD